MENFQIRSVVQYKQKRIAILLKKDMDEEEFLETCLKEFGIMEDCNNFEIKSEELSCLIKTPKHLIYNDEKLILLRKPILFIEMEKWNDEDTKSTRSSLQNFEKNFEREDSFGEETEIDENSVQGYYDNKLSENDEDEEQKEEEEEQKEEEEKEEEEKNSIQNQEGKDISEVVNIEELMNQTYKDRNEVKEKVIKLCGTNNKMRLNFRTEERTLIKDNIKISTVLCSKKDMFKCEFYLEFKTNPKTSHYELHSFFNIHNHSLLKYDTSQAFTEEMLELIKNQRREVKSTASLTKLINEKFNKNFHNQTIFNMLQQIKNQEFGKMSSDAENYVKMFEEDAKKRGVSIRSKKKIIDSLAAHIRANA